jgi:hypothetical protein
MAGHTTKLRASRERVVTALADKNPIDPSWLHHEIGRTLGDDCIIFDETVTRDPLCDHLRCDRPGSYFYLPASAGGWSPGAAFGAKLAAPERDVVSITGDGFYMFATANAALWSAAHYRAPFMSIIYQNRSYSTGVLRVDSVFPGGYAAQSGYDGGYFDPPIDFAKEAEAAGAFGENVRDPAEIALARPRANPVRQNCRRFSMAAAAAAEGLIRGASAFGRARARSSAHAGYGLRLDLHHHANLAWLGIGIFVLPEVLFRELIDMGVPPPARRPAQPDREPAHSDRDCPDPRSPPRPAPPASCCAPWSAPSRYSPEEPRFGIRTKPALPGASRRASGWQELQTPSSGEANLNTFPRLPSWRAPEIGSNWRRPATARFEPIEHSIGQVFVQAASGC